MSNKVTELFAKKIYELRKQSGLSQPSLGKKIGTSGTIIGRYERGEMTPSIEVARKFADVFEVTVDFLLTEQGSISTLQDPKMLERWQKIEKLPSEDREKILYLIDGLLRDVSARQTYGVS